MEWFTEEDISTCLGVNSFQIDEVNDGNIEEVNRSSDDNEESDMSTDELDDHASIIDEQVDTNVQEKNISPSAQTQTKKDDALTLEVGMRFTSMKEARSWYRKYGIQKGFLTRVRSTQRRSKERGDNSVTACDLVCGREGKARNLEDEAIPQGKRKKRNTSTIKCHCESRIRVVKQPDDSWMVVSFRDDHSHKFVSPVKKMKMRTAVVFPKVAQILTKKFDEANIPISKVPAIIDRETLGFSEQDCRNHLNYRLKKYKTPNEGDATAAYKYFKKRHLEDPQFFYAIECDIDGRPVNFFWVDGRSRRQYEHFGDVVCFDTTYKKNANLMPFGPFTRTNHHLQSIQFGCALLLDETEESFTWLFETWLAAMGGRPPVSIITDQDKVMTNAVRKVFPDTRHRFCLWHITQKFPDHLGHLYKKNDGFASEMNHCLHGTYTIGDFESMWGNMVRKNNLQENSWLKQVYDIREEWVPVYHLNTFYAGMNTTGRSESMNSFYKGYFTSDTNLQKFVKQFERVLERIIQRERDEDYESEHKERIVGDHQYLLKDAAKRYTRNVFNNFKDQWSRAQHYKIVDEQVGDDSVAYFMKSRQPGAVRVWKVDFNRKTKQGSCQCKLFEFRGIPCRHLVKLFLLFDVDEIPEHFVLRRFTKGANHYRVMDGPKLLSKAEDSKLTRLTKGVNLANQIAYEASEDAEKYKVMVEGFTALFNKFVEMDVSKQVPPMEEVVEPPIDEEVEPPINATTSQVFLLDPNISQTKGRKKAGESDRFKRPIETSSQHRRCTGCNKKAPHNVRTCPSLKKKD